MKRKLIAELYMFNKDRYLQRLEVEKFTPGLVIPFLNPIEVEWHGEYALVDWTPEARAKEFAKHLKRLVFEAFDSPQREKGCIVQKYILKEIE